MHIFLYGLIARPLNYIIPIKRKNWIFGSDYGHMYREGSKYMLEYMLQHHPDYNCTFITKDRQVYDELKEKGIPCEMNFSWKGIWKTLRAEYVFTSQYVYDISLTYKKRNRKFYYFVHGQSFKVAQKALPADYAEKYMGNKPSPKGFKAIVKGKISSFMYWLGQGYTMDDVEFVSSCSDFLVQFMRKDYGPEMNIKVLGMPRNDGLFQPERMEKETWISGLEGKTVITYMPTHRKYGNGEASPTPFGENLEVQEWMRENNVVFLVKQHPNMIPKMRNVVNNDVIKDISKMRLDPQVVIYHTDILITDYSSVWMDYLILKRPMFFYLYDNFEEEDAGSYFDIRDEFPEYIAEKESDLYALLKGAKEKPMNYVPSDELIHRYHKFVDGNSCERYFKEITNLH